LPVMLPNPTLAMALVKSLEASILDSPKLPP
jgi:hypothetical protein